MTDIAARARAAAFSIEGKKDGLYQKKGEDWVVRFTIQAGELCDQLRNAPLGTRYQLALVEIGDDEQPINRKGGDAPELAGAESPQRSKSVPDTQPRSVSTAQAGAEKERRSFNEMSPAQQAGMLCQEPAFIRFIGEKHDEAVTNKFLAADWVRLNCRVKSRSQITADNAAWSSIVLAYRIWQHEAQVVPA